MTGSPRTRASAWMRSTLAFVISGPCVGRSESMEGCAGAARAGLLLAPRCRRAVGAGAVVVSAGRVMLGPLALSGEPAHAPRSRSRVKASAGRAGGSSPEARRSLKCRPGSPASEAHLCLSNAAAHAGSRGWPISRGKSVVSAAASPAAPFTPGAQASDPRRPLVKHKRRGERRAGLARACVAGVIELSGS